MRWVAWKVNSTPYSHPSSAYVHSQARVPAAGGAGAQGSGGTICHAPVLSAHPFILGSFYCRYRSATGRSGLHCSNECGSLFLRGTTVVRAFFTTRCCSTPNSFPAQFSTGHMVQVQPTISLQETTAAVETNTLHTFTLYCMVQTSENGKRR